MNPLHARFVASVGLAALVSLAYAAPARAQVAPDLGTAASYTVLGTNDSPTVGTVTCTDNGPGGPINGDVGSTFTSITNTGCTITGSTDAPVDASVVSDFNLAKGALDSLNPVCDGVIPTTSTSLPPGVYCAGSSGVTLSSVTFTLNGNASDVWVFRVGSLGLGALTGNSFQVVMGGTALPCNVYWRTAQAATMTDSNFQGTILAGSAVTLTRGSFTGRAMATTDATLTDVATVDFAGCAPPGSITVAKNFVPDNGALVPMALTCTSGTVTETPLDAAEGAPAVFTVGGANLTGTTCTATEPVVPPLHTANETDCENVPLDGSCTIVNTSTSVTTMTVSKDFDPNSPAPVSVALACTGASVATTPLLASEGNPAVFTVNDVTTGAECTATETVPDGYTADETDCVDVAMTDGENSSCTITNTLDPNTITVIKDFLPNSPAAVSVDLTCTDGATALSAPLAASEGFPAVFTVNDAITGTTCTATESPVPTGYTAVQTDCVDVPVGESCTIVNTLVNNTITVFKDFIPNNGTTVPVDLTCTSGAATATPLDASEGAPAVFTVDGALEGATCTATETVPDGFTADETDCVNVPLGGDCTITNTLPSVLAIPTLGPVAMVSLVALLAGIGLLVLRRLSF